MRGTKVRRIAGALTLLLALAPQEAAGASLRRNGFALEPSSIPTSQILAGGPPRDGILVRRSGQG